MRLSGILDIQSIIDTCTLRGLDAELAIMEWSRV